MTERLPATSAETALAAAADRRSAEQYVLRAQASNTRRAYQADWRDFSAYCEARGQGSLPAQPATVALYLAWLADVQQLKAGTVARRLAAIRQAHLAAGLASPTQDLAVRSVLAGIRRTHGSWQQGKTPLLPETLKRLLAVIRPGLLGLRNRALLLLGFAAGLRRSELVALRLEDLEWSAEGLLLRIRASKGDPAGRGELVGVPRGQQPDTCPVEALRQWLVAADIRQGPIFRATEPGTGKIQARALESKRVAKVIQELAGLAGLDPGQFGGHSLRSGLATAAAQGGASERAIMEQTRHRSVQQVRRYIQRGTVFTDNAARYTGL